MVSVTAGASADIACTDNANTDTKDHWYSRTATHLLCVLGFIPMFGLLAISHCGCQWMYPSRGLSPNLRDARKRARKVQMMTWEVKQDPGRAGTLHFGLIVSK